MDRNDHIEAAEQARWRQLIADAEAELARVGRQQNAPDHAVWAARSEVDRLKREYNDYVQSFPGKLGTN